MTIIPQGDEPQQCTEEGCGREIQFTDVQEFPVVACSRLRPGLVFMLGDPMTPELEALNCPLIQRIYDGTGS